MAESERLVVILPSEIKRKLEEKAKDKSLSMSTYVKVLVTEDWIKAEKGNLEQKMSRKICVGAPFPLN
ncbi:hypothetical protein B1143_00615 [Enterococcus faecium]|uniref:hypothetical protein n=1 Tax=Enterococcus faecium TaxID=1352 RepID=UPI000E0136F5|nr:hypothetical protein [Enterococcus faecium]RCN94026.1 hypothetical protein B1143_00615 [Enterococcus faecium]